MHHNGQDGTGAEVGAAHVDPHQPVPAGGVYLQDGLAQDHGTGVVEQHVDPAVALHRQADHVVDLGLIGNIAVGGGNLSPRLADILDGLLDGAGQAGGRLAAGADDHTGPLASELVGNGPSQAAAGAGYDGHHSVHLTVPLTHSRPPQA